MLSRIFVIDDKIGIANVSEVVVVIGGSEGLFGESIDVEGLNDMVVELEPLLGVPVFDQGVVVTCVCDAEMDDDSAERVELGEVGGEVELFGGLEVGGEVELFGELEVVVDFDFGLGLEVELEPLQNQDQVVGQRHEGHPLLGLDFGCALLAEVGVVPFQDLPLHELVQSFDQPLALVLHVYVESQKGFLARAPMSALSHDRTPKRPTQFLPDEAAALLTRLHLVLQLLHQHSVELEHVLLLVYVYLLVLVVSKLSAKVSTVYVLSFTIFQLQKYLL